VKDESSSACSLLVKYQRLVVYEEQVRQSPYDVSTWCSYMEEIEDGLSALYEAAENEKRRRKSAGGKSVEVCGRAVSPGETKSAVRELQKARIMIGERCLCLLPGSYKLWRLHLQFRCSPPFLPAHYSSVSSQHRRRFKGALIAFERSLVRMNKFPRIWLRYVTFLLTHHTDVTAIRRTFDRALLALPATQHQKVWPPYISCLAQALPETDLLQHIPRLPATNNRNIPVETQLRVLRRHAHCFDPTARQTLAAICHHHSRWGEAAQLYFDMLNDASFVSPHGSTRHDLWLTLADICTQHPLQVKRAGLDFDAIVRAALSPRKAEEQQLGEMEGTLWTKLAGYHIRSGSFEVARSVYEEALESVSRVRDFTLIFDAYVKFEEGVVEALMELLQDDDDDDDSNEAQIKQEPTSDSTSDLDILLGDKNIQTADPQQSQNSSADVELALARAEYLMSRRPLLLNRVLLRQNPHNVGEWLKRSQLYQTQAKTRMAITAMEEAIKAVDAKKSLNGSPCTLYITLASIYETSKKDAEGARQIYKRACTDLEYDFVDADDLAQCFASWVEFELRQEQWDNALSVSRTSIAPATASSEKTKSNRALRALFKSLRLWNLLLDLEESLGTVQTTKDAYNKALELKVATPNHVLNYATFLTEQRYFEESFTAYERGVDLFPFPHEGAALLWKEYIKAFMGRYAGTKTARTRELFDRCLESCPPEQSCQFYLLYGEYEEEHGLTKRALNVYERMCTHVPPEEKYTAYQLYIAKTVKYLGVTNARPLYERAIAALEDAPASRMCLDFAALETKLHELHRARTAYSYGAQLADPRRDPDYWKAWHDFEVAHGNEETFREMLRVKRGVQAAFSTVNYNAAEMGAGVPKVEVLSDQAALEMIAAREGVNASEKPRISGFVQGKRTAEVADLDEVERRAEKLRRATNSIAVEGGVSSGKEEGGDEIDIDDIEDDEEEEHDELGGETEEQEKTSSDNHVSNVSTKAIPSAVFGGLASTVKNEG